MRRAALLGLLLLPPASAGAQATGSVIVGLSSAKMTADDGNTSFTTDSKTGFVVGLGLVAGLGRDLALAPELLYVQKGYSLTEDATTFDLRASYLEIPVPIRVTFGGSGGRAFLAVGPYLAFKVGCSASVDSDQGSGSMSCTGSGGEDLAGIKSTDFGLTGGVGVAFKAVTLSVRYDAGLANIASSTTDGSSVKNRAFLVMASIVVK